MQMSFNLSDDVVQQLKVIPDPDNFINQLVKKELLNYKEATDKPSKWALLAQEIERENFFSGYSEQLNKDMQEFRDNFTFPSDE